MRGANAYRAVLKFRTTFSVELCITVISTHSICFTINSACPFQFLGTWVAEQYGEAQTTSKGTSVPHPNSPYGSFAVTVIYVFRNTVEYFILFSFYNYYTLITEQTGIFTSVIHILVGVDQYRKYIRNTLNLHFWYVGNLVVKASDTYFK